MTERSMQFKRIGDDGVLTQTFPDGTWRSMSMPLDEWADISHQIQAEMRNRENVVPIRGGAV